MSWSTRELADLAGTTVNTVRHYHRLGLLEEPDRRYNGYKQYEVRHLVSLLRIRRLAVLGIPLSQLGSAADAARGMPEMLREVDAELQQRIESLNQARAHIAAIIEHQAPVDVPAGFEAVASRLSESDRSIVHLMTRFYDEKALEDIRKMSADESDDTGPEMDNLPADADEQTRQALAERVAEIIVKHLVNYPWLRNPAPHLPKGRQASMQTFGHALAELYNEAQLDVLFRANVIAVKTMEAAQPQEGEGSMHSPE
ncbi:MerR family transcriptional regulator [Arthrobacter gandavensis]|uniref:helix-turn-helix domain-containing protein n=1 Tax=Arthrobacter gandavensis TaxID=169960 RepID=UPI00188EF878|nr:MerR family transcriptional regulator [Arthrobacter gandavensis]MBF4994821.1 MerR family transcriptional regulator [Arthrobacter gandavensis]